MEFQERLSSTLMGQELMELKNGNLLNGLTSSKNMPIDYVSQIICLPLSFDMVITILK